MNLIKVEGYCIPDARSVLEHPQWISLWQQRPTESQCGALRRGITFVERWRVLLAKGSKDSVVRVRLVAANGAWVLDAYAPKHEHAGEIPRSMPPPAFEPSGVLEPHRFSVGQVITNPNPENPGAVIVSKVIRIDAERWGEPWYLLEDLYLGTRYSTTIKVYDVEGYRLATEKDHELAKAYAAKWEDQSSGGSGGGAKPEATAKRRASGKHATSKSSQAATRETQNGSQRESASHAGPSHSASSATDSPPVSSTTAASESRKPKPKKRRMPRDQVS